MIEKTVGSAGADYATWQDANDDNPDPADDIRFTAITADDLGPLDVDCGNANSKRIIFLANEASCFRSAAGWPVMATAAGQCARVGGALNVNTPGVEVYDLVVTGGIEINQDCLLVNVITTGTFSSYNIFGNSGATVTGVNLAMLGQGPGIFNNGLVCDLYYCSYGPPAGAAGNGYFRTAGTLNCWGCISVNGAFGGFSGTIGGDENVSDDATAPGTTNWQSQTTVYADIANGDLHMHADHEGDYPTSDYSGTEPLVAFDIDDEARTSPGADAGCDTTGEPVDQPNATYDADSQACEGANGTISPASNTGGPITSAALAAGSPALPTGYTINANGTIAKVGASMLATDIGSRTLLLDLTNSGGTQEDVEVPITITANPPTGTYNGGEPIVDHCGWGENIYPFEPTGGPAPAANSFTISEALTDLTFATTDGEIATDPPQGHAIRAVTRTVTFESPGGQVGQVEISVKFNYQFTVTANTATNSATVTMDVGSSGGGTGGGVIGAPRKAWKRRRGIFSPPMHNPQGNR